MEITKASAKIRFIMFLICGILLGGFAAMMFAIGAAEKNLIPTLIAAAVSLGAVFLLGFSFKYLYMWQKN